MASSSVGALLILGPSAKLAGRFSIICSVSDSPLAIITQGRAPRHSLLASLPSAPPVTPAFWALDRCSPIESVTASSSSAGNWRQRRRAGAAAGGRVSSRFYFQHQLTSSAVTATCFPETT